MQLLDVNVWIALAFQSHVHHVPATTWFDSQPTKRYFFCRMTQYAFLRLATNPRMVGTQARTMSQAWESYDALMDDPRVEFVAEPRGVELYWRNFTQQQTFSPQVWADAYLAAFAIVGGYELVTFDKAFSKFARVQCIFLKA